MLNLASGERGEVKEVDAQEACYNISACATPIAIGLGRPPSNEPKGRRSGMRFVSEKRGVYSDNPTSNMISSPRIQITRSIF